MALAQHILSLLLKCWMEEEKLIESEQQDGGAEMVAIRWCRPNSVFDGVVQFVSKSVVKSVDEEGNAVVLWPRKGREAEVWRGTVEPSKSKHYTDTYM